MFVGVFREIPSESGKSLQSICSKTYAYKVGNEGRTHLICYCMQGKCKQIWGRDKGTFVAPVTNYYKMCNSTACGSSTFRIIVRTAPGDTFKISQYCKSQFGLGWFKWNSNSYFRVFEPLVYQISYPVFWKECTRSIQGKCARSSRDNLTLIINDIQCFHSIYGSSLG